jgi:hypothetical protein
MTNKLTPGEALQKILDALGVDDLNVNSRGLFEDYIRQAARAESAKELAEKDAKIASQKESIRCMSVVFDDIAKMLNLPKEQYGDPDALMDAIAATKKEG